MAGSPTDDQLRVNHELVSVLGLESLLPLFQRAGADTVALHGHAPHSKNDAHATSAGMRTWVWRDGVDVVVALDENRDGNAPGARPDSLEDCYVVDLDGDGTIDQVVDWQDLDHDKRADRQIIYSISAPYVEKEARLRAVAPSAKRPRRPTHLDHPPITNFVIEAYDAHRGFWHLDRWRYLQHSCQTACDFHGDAYFTWGKYDPDRQTWTSFFENPFAFYDNDGDGLSDEAMQVCGQGTNITSVRWSVDTDLDATAESYDYDLSVTGIGRFGLGPSLADTIEVRGGSMTLLSWSKARAWLREAEFARAVLVADENDRNIAPGDSTAFERWEGVIADSPPGFPSLGGPTCGQLNKRYEYFGTGLRRHLGLYHSEVDGRIHLFGATFGEIIVDHDLDGVADAILRMEDRDDDGYFDTWLWDDDADGTADSVLDAPGAEVTSIPLDHEAVRIQESEITRRSAGLGQAERYWADVQRWTQEARFTDRRPAARQTEPIVASQTPLDADTRYRTRFEEKFPRTDSPSSLEEYASRRHFDLRFGAEGPCADTLRLNNDSGVLAWELASDLLAYNEMYRATHEPAYLRASLECIRPVLEARDDRRGRIIEGRHQPSPVWSSVRYSSGRRIAHLVHTGQIVYPMLDALDLARRQQPHMLDELHLEIDEIVAALHASLDFHRTRWRDGPNEGEGYYQEDDPRIGTPQPANALSTFGAALWMSWKASENTEHRDRAVALAHYMKNRMEARPDGTYLWTYQLPHTTLDGGYGQQSGEDTSHAGLTVFFPTLLAADNTVFDTNDLERFARTALLGFAREADGVLYPTIDGNPASNPHFVGTPGRWLRVSRYAPELYDRIALFYRTRVPEPTALEQALLILYAPSER